MQPFEKKLNRYQKNQQGYGKKKHVTQMNELEKEFLLRKFKSVDKTEWSFTEYSQDRFNERGIDPAHFMSIFSEDAQLIEYHKKYGTNRILLRGKATHKGYQVCVVFCPENKTIVTAYLNHVTNQHQNLKEEYYDADIDVLKQYKGGE